MDAGYRFSAQTTDTSHEHRYAVLWSLVTGAISEWKDIPSSATAFSEAVL